MMRYDVPDAVFELLGTTRTANPGNEGRQLAHLKEKLKLVPAMQLEALMYRARWRQQARPAQYLPARQSFYWLLKPGRGWGKTRTGAEDCWWESFIYPGLITGVIGATNDDTRKIAFEGPAGILTIMPPKLRAACRWNRSEMVLQFPNKSVIYGYSAEKPDRLRGPQHHKLWAEEVAAWNDPSGLWDMAMMGLRLQYTRPGEAAPLPQFPRAVFTTTPRPIPLIKELVADPDTVVVDGTTYENAANLAPKTLEKLRKKYEGTRLGRQELGGEILDDNPGALWSYTLLDKQRLRTLPTGPFERIVVGVDPNVSDGTESDECGIVLTGRIGDQGYVLADDSVGDGPKTWAPRVVETFRRANADLVVAEVNNGGDLVEMAIRAIDPAIPVLKVHASRGKIKRAEPVAMLYQQGRVWHLGTFPKLEDQMTTFDPNRQDQGSPDRMDAAVWALTAMLLPDEMPLPTIGSGAVVGVPFAVPAGY